MQAFLDVASFHRDLYEKAFAEASLQSAMTAPSIKNYAKKFEASLPAKARQVQLRTILDTLNSRALLLFGDFHTLKQSQLALMRVLHAYRLLQPNRQMILALEMFKAKDTSLVQKYVRGELSEAEFLSSIAYENDWGFPWKNYKPILDFARRHGLVVCGINTDQGGKEALNKRDRFAATRLLELTKRYPKALVVSLIGEFHLADNHLPFALKREMLKTKHHVTWTRVITNVDRYFFTQPTKLQQVATEYLYLKDDLFSIQNTPPWIKWQTFTIWEELRAVQGNTLDYKSEEGLIDEYYTEDSFDLDYQILKMMRGIAPVLGIPANKKAMQEVNVLYAPDESTLLELREKKNLSSLFFASLIDRLAFEGFAYIAPHRIFLVNEVSLNNLAQIVGYHLFYVQLSERNRSQPGEALFVRRVLATLASTLVSKIVNPRRANFTLNDYTRILYGMNKRKVTGFALRRRETAKRLIAFVSKVKEGKAPRLDACAKFDNHAAFDLSVALGSLLGELTYNFCISKTQTDNPWKPFFSVAGQDDGDQAAFFWVACRKLLV